MNKCQAALLLLVKHIELGLLLSAAEAAKGHSLSTEAPVVLYRDLLPKAT